MSMLRQMLTSIPQVYWAIAKWNTKYNAVEIIKVQSPYCTNDVATDIFDFLLLPQDVRNVLGLQYLEDGTVLSGRDIPSIRRWAEILEGIGFKTTVLSDIRANVLLEFNLSDQKRWIELGDDIDTHTVCVDGNKYPGFPNRLSAERFLMRLLPREKGLYFLNGSDEELIQLLDSDPDDYKLGRHTLSVGYGDMPYSIASSNEEGEVDSIYFTWLKMPEWCGNYVVVQSSLDCNTGHFCEDFEADVVQIEFLDQAMQSLIENAIGWFCENNTPFDQAEVDELMKTIVADIEQEFPEHHPQIRSMDDVLKLLKIEKQMQDYGSDFQSLGIDLTAAASYTYNVLLAQPFIDEEPEEPEVIGVIFEDEHSMAEFFFPFSQHALLQRLNQPK